MTITTLKTGRYQARVTWYDANGKRINRKKSFDHKAEAAKWELEMNTLKRQGTLSVRSEEVFAEYFWSWYERYKDASVGDRTRRTYLTAYHALQGFMPPIPIGKITRRDYRTFMVRYGRNHSKSTVTKFNALYHACVKDAVMDGDIAKDFIRTTDVVFSNAKTRKIEYLSITEMHQLVAYLITSCNPHFTSKYMILTAIYTGARLGEIQGLTWGNINETEMMITIDHSYADETRTIKTTKNDSSNRVIRINHDLIRLLNQLKKPLAGAKSMVFLNQYGTIPTSAAVNKTLRESLAAIDLNKRGFHFHSLRHTHVAYLLSHNVPLYVIAKRLGHADISTTSRIYSYLIDEFREKTDNQIEMILDEANPNNHHNHHQIV